MAALLLACGGFSGWRLRASMRDHGLELRAQVADINWLQAALTDSEKRCAQQAEWLNAMEAELIALRAQEPGSDPQAASTTPANRGRPGELAQR